MLKIAAQGSCTARLVACLSANSVAYAGGPLNAVAATQKFLSNSQTQHKKFDIKDHDDFDKKVINSVRPIIVNFHAEWCDPCKILTPKMIEMLEFDENVDLAIIDVDQNSDLVETFELKAVPAVIAFNNGQIVDKFIGLSDAGTIEKLIGRLRGETPPEPETADKASNKS